MANKKWLIDANEAIERAKESDKIVGSSIWETCEVVEFLEDCPIVDVVEVARCKDCKWYAPNNEGSWIGCAFDTSHPDDVPKADDFCSYGERKDNG